MFEGVGHGIEIIEEVGDNGAQAVCELLAEAFGVPRRDVQVIAGKTRPQKTVKLCGLQLQQAEATLARLIET